MPKVAHTTKTFEDLLLAIKGKGLKVTQAKAGVKLDVGPGIEAVMLAPNNSSYDDLNNYSAVLKITYGSTSFLFTGDAEAESESEMLRTGYDLKADVLKVGHHGSSSSTTQAFLKAVSPKYAVISVGKDNKYGHPHTETLAKLAEAGIQVFRTDLQGTIVATSDGKTITFNKKASPAKERAPDDSRAAASSNPVTPPASTSSSGGVRIVGIDLKSEVVTIKNTSGVAVNLSGWKLVSQKGNQTFTFPSGIVIPAGGSLKVVSGPNAQTGPNTLLWTKRYIWNNNGDPGALYDAQGKLVSRYE
ncbi:hydrolase [Calderihabitans maritimus]|uniref:Hydrolase n=1 Tax=Calderihabitans maritimus TaxID=1246530 RepID=A0A1Z5HTC0_9FIRM|nr:hydrolase [Calderihabitans maritimus]